VRVPGVVASGGAGASAWLLLEWLEPGPATPRAWEDLGRALAALHRTRAERFGADQDNYIGSLPQANGWSTSWPAFWRERRLGPQQEQAVGAGLLGSADARAFDRLSHRLDELLAPAADEGASLLHGDLWSGNVHMMDGGTAAVIDPSVYHGHREVDLAMAELFGGFGGRFRHAYEESWPLAPGYDPVRRSVYQVYYLLVHVNLFGPGYVGRTREALRRTGAHS
jgi:fructosamine-3-kinase